MAKSTKRTTKKRTVQQLDDHTSALVLAELLVLGDVKESEINAILEVQGHPCTPRDIAITFRISDVLGTPACFVMAPRFQSVFAELRVGLARVQLARAQKDEAAGAA